MPRHPRLHWLSLTVLTLLVSVRLSGADSQDIPEVGQWASDVPFPAHVRNADDYRLLSGSLSIASGMYGHPRLQVDYLIPVDGKGRVLPSAGDMVAMFPTPGGKAIEYGSSKTLAKNWGFTVFSVNFPNHNKARPNDKQKYWIYPEAQACQVWLTAASGVRLLAKLPVRPFFVAGYSCGGSAAQLFASGAPDQVAAAIFISGRTFECENPYPGPVLIMRSDRDREVANEALMIAMKKNFVPPIELTFLPEWSGFGKNQYWDHNVDGMAWDFGISWLAAVANKRDRQTGQMAPASAWSKSQGKLWPEVSLGERSLAFPTPPAVRSHPDGYTEIEVRPGPSAELKGSVCWFDRRIFCNEDELTGAGQLLSRAGVAFTGFMSSDRTGNCSIAALSRKALTSKTFPSPRTLVVVDPDESDIASIKSAPGNCSRLVLIDPSLAIAALAMENPSALSLKVSLICRESVYAKIKDAAPNSRRVRLVTYPYEGLPTIGDRLAFWTNHIFDAAP